MELSNNNALPQVFVDSIEVGSWLDVYNDSTSKWEIASVERFSEFRTELEIRWSYNGKRATGLSELL